jgi:hypothetical protein
LRPEFEDAHCGGYFGGDYHYPLRPTVSKETLVG